MVMGQYPKVMKTGVDVPSHLFNLSVNFESWDPRASLEMSSSAAMCLQASGLLDTFQAK